jgi:hypothetical protein
MHPRTIGILLCSVLSMGCRPPEAPQDLDRLSSYLFGNTWTNDPKHLEVGLDNLRSWLEDNLEETEEGFEVNILNQKQVDSLDNCKRDITGLVGAAVATRSDYAIQDMVRTNIDIPSQDVYTSTVYSKRLDFAPDKSCYLDQDCDQLQYRTVSEAEFDVGFTVMNVRSKNGIQHQWVETEHGTANVYRTWMQKPAIVSIDNFHLDTQFFLSATMPWEDGSIRLQATWAATQLGNLPVPEAFALSQAIKTMQRADSEVSEYLSED